MHCLRHVLIFALLIPMPVSAVERVGWRRVEEGQVRRRRCLPHVVAFAVLLLPAHTPQSASPFFLAVFAVAAYWAIRPCGYCVTMVSWLRLVWLGLARGLGETQQSACCKGGGVPWLGHGKRGSSRCRLARAVPARTVTARTRCGLDLVRLHTATRLWPTALHATWPRPGSR